MSHPESGLLAVASALFALSVAGCEQACPSQPSPCASSATLRFALEKGDPEAFEVRIRVVEHGVEQTDRCLLIVPLPADWPGSGLTAACVNNVVSLQLRPIVDADCDTTVAPGPDGIQAGAECHTKILGHELVLVRSGQPETIEIALVNRGVAFAPLSVEPQYADSFPDGEHCSARCPVASEQRAFVELTRTAEAG